MGLIVVLLSGCAASQKTPEKPVQSELSLETFVREWKEKKSSKAALAKAYLEYSASEKKTKGCFTAVQEEIPLANAKAYGLSVEGARRKLKKLSRVEFNKKEFLLALYALETEPESLVASILQKAEDGGYREVFESKEEGNTFFNVSVFSPGKETGDYLFMEYGVCSCSPTSAIYGLTADGSLREIYSVYGEGVEVVFEDLDNDGICELVEINNMRQSAELTEALKGKIKNTGSGVLMLAAMVTKIVIYKWDGKKFKNAAELYR